MTHSEILSADPPQAGMRLSYGDDPLNFGDLRLPDGGGPHPVIVVVHGGFWRARYDLEHIGLACQALTTALGAATWSLEYRRIGNPGGGWPGTFLDVSGGLDHVRLLASPYNLDLSRVVTIGHSAGGHLALWLAARGRIPPESSLYSDPLLALRGAVSLAGVLDLRLAYELGLSGGVVEEFLGGSPSEVPQRYIEASPIRLLPLGVPQVLLHGTEDEPVPYKISQLYAEAALAAGDGVELGTLPGCGHFELIDPQSEQWDTVVQAVRGLLS